MEPVADAVNLKPKWRAGCVLYESRRVAVVLRLMNLVTFSPTALPLWLLYDSINHVIIYDRLDHCGFVSCHNDLPNRSINAQVSVIVR